MTGTESTITKVPPQPQFPRTTELSTNNPEEEQAPALPSEVRNIAHMLKEIGEAENEANRKGKIYAQISAYSDENDLGEELADNRPAFPIL